MSGHASGEYLAPMPFDPPSVVTNGYAPLATLDGEQLPFPTFQTIPI